MLDMFRPGASIQSISLHRCPDACARGRQPRMLSRRSLLAASFPAVLAVHARAATDSFQGFLAGLRPQARRNGISGAPLDRAFAGVQPNQKVLERDRHQPEFTMTW